MMGLSARLYLTLSVYDNTLDATTLRQHILETTTRSSIINRHRSSIKLQDA
jgi:hypothetical protein